MRVGVSSDLRRLIRLMEYGVEPLRTVHGPASDPGVRVALDERDHADERPADALYRPGRAPGQTLGLGDRSTGVVGLEYAVDLQPVPVGGSRARPERLADVPQRLGPVRHGREYVPRPVGLRLVVAVVEPVDPPHPNAPEQRHQLV